MERCVVYSVKCLTYIFWLYECYNANEYLLTYLSYGLWHAETELNVLPKIELVQSIELHLWM
jgi:hypothetical protein